MPSKINKIHKKTNHSTKIYNFETACGKLLRKSNQLTTKRVRVPEEPRFLRN